MLFTQAKRHQARARFAIDGVSGSGKTYTALVLAQALAEGGKVAVLDTEHGSASLYSDIFGFDVSELDTFDPKQITDAIEYAEENGYAVLVIDSLSHFWEGEGGLLDSVDKIAKSKYQNNSFAAWKDGSPVQRSMIDAILQSKLHVIVTMRSKTEYSIERDEKTGKMSPKKVGLAPVQRQGIEYEFQVVGDMDINHNLIITKSRCSILQDEVINKPTVKSFENYVAWLKSGDVAIFTKKKGPRPYSPEQLKERLGEFMAGYKPDIMVTVNQRELCVGTLSALFHDDVTRHAACNWLIGEPSTQKMMSTQIKALLDWMQPAKTDTGYIPSEYAAKEADAVIKTVMVEQSQTEMPLA